MKKRIIITLCICLGVVLLFYMCLPYKIGSKPDYKLAREQGDIQYESHLIHKNAFGLVTVYEYSIKVENSGTILAICGVSFDKHQTHLTMLSSRKGMSLSQMVAALGMPDYLHGSGLVRLRYKVGNGYYYDYFFSKDGRSLNRWAIQGPDGNYLSDEDAAAFQWTVRLVYLGVAAILSVVLVLLIKIPNAIRKRKAAIQGG